MSATNALLGPYRYAFTITGNDTVALANTTSAIHALTTGNVKAVFLSGNALTNVTFPVVQGTIYPFRLTQVYATGSTANVIGLI